MLVQNCKIEIIFQQSYLPSCELKPSPLSRGAEERSSKASDEGFDGFKYARRFRNASIVVVEAY